MRVALTGLSGRRRPTNLPRKSRLAAISLRYEQPKTHPRLGIKKPVRSCDVDSLIRRGTKTRSGQARDLSPAFSALIVTRIARDFGQAKLKTVFSIPLGR